MKRPHLTRLYKYSPISANTLKALALDSAWYPKVETLNDPYDCRATVQNDLTDDRILSIAKKRGFSASTRNTVLDEVRRRCVEYWEAINDCLLKVGVLSLSEINDSITMWGHYARSHTGICIEFERTKENLLGIGGIEVEYSGYRRYKASEFLDKGSHEVIAYLLEIIGHKTSDWRYEHEWRAASDVGDRYGPMPGNITSVIFGMNCSPTDALVVASLVMRHYPECKFLESKRKTGSLELEMVPVELDRTKILKPFGMGFERVSPDRFKPSWAAANHTRPGSEASHPDATRPDKDDGKP
jgi:hypothetical protein